MARLFLGSLVLSWITVYAFCQLVRGYRFGVVSVWHFRKNTAPNDFKVIVDGRRVDSPLLFWLWAVIYMCLVAATPWALWQAVLEPYLLGEVAPTISFVQPIDRNHLHVSWDPPKRLDEPISYVVYRLDPNTSNKTRLATKMRDSTQYVDKDVEEGTSYTYQVEAQFKGLTAWMIGDRSTLSSPVSGQTLSW